MAKAAPSEYPKQRREIDADIKTGTFRPLYLITGEEEYLRKQVKTNLRNALCEGGGENNLLRVKGEKTDPQEIIAFASTMPFFAKRRVVIAEETGFFKKGSEDLAEWLKQPPDTAVLVFVESQIDKRTALYKAAVKRGREISCDRQTPGNIRLWAGSRLKKAGRKFSERTLDHFLSGLSGDLMHIESELNKLIDYTEGREEITAKDVDKITSGITTSYIFALTDALAERNADEAMRQYVRMLQTQEEPNHILAMIARQFHMLLQVKELEQRHAGDDQIAKETGLHPGIVYKYVRWTKRFSQPELKRALEVCLENEQALKRGRLDKKIAVEMVIAAVISSENRGGTNVA
ncbi:MAG: DNA polymerase III subunit delta [Lachnospiraceae bacterium]|nr:DNA polymerase III subunit delta [Lachnospiraceae bacterium]